MNSIKARHILAKIWVRVFILLLPEFVLAQVHTIARGETIRITVPEYFHNPIVGNFIHFKNDSLYFQLNKRLFTIPLRQVTKLEVARGKKSNTKKGAIIGGITGGLGLGVIAAIDASGDQSEWISITPGQAFSGSFIVGSLIGSVAGAIIGSGSKSTRWEEVPLPGLSMAKGKPAFIPKIRRLEEP